MADKKEIEITQHGEKSVAIVANAGSVVTLQDKQCFEEVSAALENYTSEIGPCHIDRKETETLLEWLRNTPEPNGSARYEKRIAILLGKAGSGKSVVMKDILLALQKESEYRVLAFKSDIFYDGEDNRDLNEKARLGQSVIDAIRESAQTQRTILLIDQIDALSAVLSSRRKPLDEMMGLIKQAALIPNVRVVTSCRPYDFHYDQKFADLKNCYQVVVRDLEKEDVTRVLEANGVVVDSTYSEELMALLSNPLNLSLFCTIRPDANTLRVKTLTDLYDCLWNKMLDDYPEDSERLVICLWEYASQLYQRQTLSMSAALFPSKWHDEKKYLLSKGILVENKGVYQFMHQTLFDYVFARLFFEQHQTLEEMFEKEHQGLFMRNHLKQILEYQRATDNGGFSRNVRTILFEKTADRFDYKYRFHIQHLVLSILGSFETYTPEEKRLIDRNILPSNRYHFHFVDTIITLGGFGLYRAWIDKKGGFFAADESERESMFIILGKMLSMKPKETIRYIRTLCVQELQETYRTKLIALVERMGKIEMSEDERFVIGFLDDKDSEYVFPLLMHANVVEHTDWVVSRTLAYVKKRYEDSGKAEMLKYHPSISHNIQLIYDDLKRHLPFVAYQFGYEIVRSVAEMSMLQSEHDIKGSLAYVMYNRHNTHTAELHEETVDDMMAYLGKRLKEEATPDNVGMLDELISTDLCIMHVIAAEALCEGMNHYVDYAFRYLKDNIGRSFISSVLLHYQIKLFKTWVLTNPSRELLDELMSVIKNIYPEWENHPLDYPNRRTPLTRVGFTRAQYYACVPEEILKTYPKEHKFFIEMQHKWNDFENEEPNKIEMHEGYTTLKREAFDNLVKDSDILQTMRKINNDDDIIDFSKPTLTGVSASFAQKAQQDPDKYFGVYLKALEDETIPLKYSIDGLEALMECKYAQDKIDQLLCRLIEEVPKRKDVQQPITNMTICSRIEYYEKNDLLMPEEVYGFVKGVALHPSSDEDDTDDIDFNLPINRERGRAIDILEMSFFDKAYADDIIDTLLAIVPDASVTSKVGMLFRMAYLLNVSKEKTLQLFLDVTRDANPNYYRLPVHNANPVLYLVRTNFDDLIPYFESAVQAEKGNDVTANLLFRAWLLGKEKAKEMLLQFADQSVAARVQVIDFVGRYFRKDFAEQMMEVLVRYMAYKEEALGKEYDEVFSKLEAWGELFDTQTFLNRFIKSEVCVHCSYRIYEYLKSLAVENPEYCLDLLSALYAKKSNTYAVEHYELQQITEILIEAYNNVRTYTSDNESLEHAMDLMDNLLEKEDVNYYLTNCLKTLEE